MSSKFVNIMRSLYSNITESVKLHNGGTSNEFDISIGLLQGCNLSPYLFNLYINDLCKILDQANIDPVSLKSKKISSLMCADDMLILSNTECGMQKALDILDEYCSKCQLVVNPDKTKIVIFNKKQMDIDVEYRGNKLSVATEYAYLGLNIHKSGSFLPAIKELRRKAQKAYFQVKAVLKDDNCPQLYTHMFDVLVKPILLLSSDVWGGFGHRKNNDPNLTCKLFSNELSPFEKLHMQCCKDGLRLPITVSNMGCRSELGRFPLIKDVLINVIKFDMRLKSDINQELLQAAHFSQEQLSKNSQNTYTCTHCQFIQRVSDELHLESNGTFQCNQLHLLKSKLKTEGKKISAKSENYYIGKIYKPFMSTKRNNVHAKLHLKSQVKDDFTYEEYLNIRGINSLIRFKLSAHWLPIERGRHKRPIINREDRLCPLCKTCVGDEIHALMSYGMQK